MDLHTSKNINEALYPSLNDDFISLKQFPSFILDDVDRFKNQILRYSEGFEHVSILDNNFPSNQNQRGYLAGIGAKELIQLAEEHGSFEFFDEFVQLNHEKWIFGMLSYDLKNDTENINSENQDLIGFPKLQFFTPEILIYIEHNVVYISTSELDPTKLFEQINSVEILDTASDEVKFSPGFIKKPDDEDYLRIIKALKEEIANGNIYEINFCRQLLAKCRIDPYLTNIALNSNSPAPFSAYYKSDSKHLICASPERFILKSGNKLMSQPIKGTRPRKSNKIDDERMKSELLESKKEQAENVMIVDLVRNDLSHTAQKGSVIVEELFGLYTFPHVHQMISTVSSMLKPDVSAITALKHCFPMGSMTGAPKLRAMKLIEQHEHFQRGIFSGSVGFITPSENFDFNVVIRSIAYNEENEMVSIPTGSAITSMCHPSEELEECELKSRALIDCLREKKHD